MVQGRWMVLALALNGCGGGGERDAGDTAEEETIDVADAVEEDSIEDVVAEDVEEEEVPVPSDLLYVHTVSADYGSGSYTVVELDGSVVHGDIDVMHTDAKALCFPGAVFLNELSGADTVDPVRTEEPWDVLARIDVGDLTNPVDAIPVDATHLVVVFYDATAVAEIDLASGTFTGRIVDLSGFDTRDALPQSHAIAHAGSRYFVSMQRLDGWTPTVPGLVVVLDDETLDVVDADPSTGPVDGIVLPGMNPVGRFRALGGDLYIALTGTWGATDGGIAVVDTAALEASWVVEGADIGGDPVFGDAWEIVDETTAFVAYALEDGSHDAVKAFDPSAGTASTSDVIVTDAYAISGSALSRDGRMFVGDRGSSPGVRVIDTGTGTEITPAISSGSLPPYSLCVYAPSP